MAVSDVACNNNEGDMSSVDEGPDARVIAMEAVTTAVKGLMTHHAPSSRAPNRRFQSGSRPVQCVQRCILSRDRNKL